MSLRGQDDSPAELDVTLALERVRRGDTSAVQVLLPQVYDQLRAIAARQLSSERPDHTLQATALVHEAYLKLVRQTQVEWQGRAHFFAVAASAMRRILVDHARTVNADKRGGGSRRVDLAEAEALMQRRDVDVAALDQAMTRLAESEPQAARVVEMRFFGGATEVEIAEVLGVSDRTVRRHWVFARAWLFRELGGGEERAEDDRPRP